MSDTTTRDEGEDAAVGPSAGEAGTSDAAPRPWYRSVVLWDLVPVAVSLTTSLAFIVRSVAFVDGKRFYALFDDAGISMTYARNFVQGHGLVWMPGQPRVEGYSNFLWTLWMSVIEWFGPSDRLAGLWVMLTGVVLLAATTYLVCRIARRLAPGSGVAGPLAGLAVALYYGLTYWTLLGMETGLVAVLYAGAALCALRACEPEIGRAVHGRMLAGAAVLLSLGVLTRDDALVFAAVVSVFVWRRAGRHLRDAAWVAGPVVVVFALHVAFRLAYYGRPFPNTYYLKTSGIPLTTRVNRGWVVVAQNLTMQLVVAVLLAAAYFWLRRRSGRPAELGTGMLAWAFAIQAVYLVYVGGDSYDAGLSDRYLCVVVPFLLVLAVLGACQIAALDRSTGVPLVAVGVGVIIGGTFIAASVLPVQRLQLLQPQRWHPSLWVVLLWVVGGVFVVVGLLRRATWFPGRPAAVAVLIVAGVVVAVSGAQVRDWWSANYLGYGINAIVTYSAMQLQHRTVPGTTIAVLGAGNTPYFAHRPAVDLFGYSDRVIANSKPHTTVYVKGFGFLPLAFQPGHDKWDYDYSIGKLRPDVIVGLVSPTPAQLARIRAWGYVENGAGQYYLPGKLRSASG